MPVQLLDEDKPLTVKDSDLPDITDGDDGTTYTVRQITPEKSKEIRKKHTTHPINRRTGVREELVDADAVLDDTIDHILTGWSGIVHKGKPVDCTREMKLLLDYPRKTALVIVAGGNQVDREGSF